ADLFDRAGVKRTQLDAELSKLNRSAARGRSLDPFTRFADTAADGTNASFTDEIRNAMVRLKAFRDGDIDVHRDHVRRKQAVGTAFATVPGVPGADGVAVPPVPRFDAVIDSIATARALLQTPGTGAKKATRDFRTGLRRETDLVTREIAADNAKIAE